MRPDPEGGDRPISDLSTRCSGNDRKRSARPESRRAGERYTVGVRLLALLLLFPASALAEARLRISSDRPIVIVVNMIPHTFAEGTTKTVDFKDGKEGRQNVTVRNLLGQEVWSGHVDVPRNHEVRARWSGRIFEVVETKTLASAPPSPRPAGATRSGATKLDQLAEDAGSGPRTPLDGVETLLAHAPDPVTAVAVPSVGPTPPPAGVPSTLKLVNRTTSWANVYVNGDRIEFRGKPEPIELDLPSGAHRVIVKDFQDREIWGQGEVWVYPDEVVELHFSRTPAPATVGKPDAWHPVD